MIISTQLERDQNWNQDVVTSYYLSWGKQAGFYMVVLATSFMLSSGSALSGQRRTQGAKTMANEFGDMRLWASTLQTLQEHSVENWVMDWMLNDIIYCKWSNKDYFYLTRWKINLSNVLKFAGGSSSSTLYIAWSCSCFSGRSVSRGKYII